jgi:hypothetical protein
LTFTKKQRIIVYHNRRMIWPVKIERCLNIWFPLD